MAVLAPEAIEATDAVATGGVASGAAKARAGRGTRGKRATGRAAQLNQQAASQSSEARARQRAIDRQQAAEEHQQQKRQQQAQSFAQARGREAASISLPGDRQYQGVILAEFVIAVIVVSTGPLVNPPSDGKGGPSPYRVNHLKQLLAIGMTYFILALFSSGRHGRIAAWFGGLVLLGLGFAQLANGDLTAFFRIFGPGGGPADQGIPQAPPADQGIPIPGGDLPTPGLGQPIGINQPPPGLGQPIQASGAGYNQIQA